MIGVFWLFWLFLINYCKHIYTIFFNVNVRFVLLCTILLCFIWNPERFICIKRFDCFRFIRIYCLISLHFLYLSQIIAAVFHLFRLILFIAQFSPPLFSPPVCQSICLSFPAFWPRTPSLIYYSSLLLPSHIVRFVLLYFPQFLLLLQQFLWAFRPFCCRSGVLIVFWCWPSMIYVGHKFYESVVLTTSESK